MDFKKENIENIGKDSLSILSFYIRKQLSEEDKNIIKIQENIIDVFEELISRVTELLIHYDNSFELNAEKQKLFDSFVRKKTNRINNVKDEINTIQIKKIKSNIYKIIDVLNSFKKADIEDDEISDFIYDYIVNYHIDDLILNNLFTSFSYEENFDIQLFLEMLTIFPLSETVKVGLEGNKYIGYLETDNFNFDEQDRLIEKFIEMDIDNSNLSLMLTRYRIASENWLYHCEIMNNYENILKGKGKPQRLDNLIDDKKINPIDFYYGINLMNEALQKKYYKKAIVYFLALIILPILILFNSDNKNLIYLSILVLSLVIIREIYLIIKKIIIKFLKKENSILKLRSEMMMLSFDLEGNNKGTFSSIDTEDILNKIRDLRNKGVAYPPSLIHLLKKELSKGNYQLKIN